MSSIFLTIVRKFKYKDISGKKMSKFSERLKELRVEKNIGQIELAKAINVSKGIISLWENDLREPKMFNLIELAKFFDVSIDYLVGMVD